MTQLDDFKNFFFFFLSQTFILSFLSFYLHLILFADVDDLFAIALNTQYLHSASLITSHKFSVTQIQSLVNVKCKRVKSQRIRVVRYTKNSMKKKKKEE